MQEAVFISHVLVRALLPGVIYSSVWLGFSLLMDCIFIKCYHTQLIFLMDFSLPLAVQ